MQSTMVRINKVTHERLVKLAEEAHSSIQSVLNDAVEAYRREALMERTNQAYAALRSDPVAWAEYQKEQETWDRTAGDGL
jgi:hypothetical protein